MFREFPASPQTCLRRWTRLTIVCLGNARCGYVKSNSLEYQSDSRNSSRLCLVFHCADAVCAGQKMEKEVGVSERSEFRPLPIFCPAQTGTPKGQRRRGRLSLLTFFGEAKKVSGRRATPGNPSLIEVWIDETEQRTWFLFEAGRNADSTGH